jgi:hypothetical protein
VIDIRWFQIRHMRCLIDRMPEVLNHVAGIEHGIRRAGSGFPLSLPGLGDA